MTPRIHLYLLLLPWAVMLALGLMFERPEFRPFELAIRSDLKFHANRTIEMDAYGALAYRYHAPHLAQLRHNVFTTDAAGLRNATFQRAPTIVATGDSFVVGVGVSDHETIPSRLTHHLQTPVYNYGTQDKLGPTLFLTDRRFAQRPPRVLLYMPSASTMLPIEMPKRVRAPEAPRTAHSPASPAPSVFTRAAARWRRWGAPLQSWIAQVDRDNGLKKTAQRQYHALHRAIFGFPERIEVDDAPALVVSLEDQKLLIPTADRDVEAVIASWRAFAQANAERGTRVLFAPLPETGDLYLDAFPDHARAAQPRFFDVVLERATAAGLWTYDLRPPLASRRTPYLFLRDDTHYAPRANDIVAQTLARALTSSVTSTPSP